MSVLTVPPLEKPLWPTLGPQVCDMIEELCVYGPGDLRGQPAQLDDETRLLIYRMYEVFPHGDPRAGRRRFKRCGISLRKGSAKTEKAAWIAAIELHPEAPVRCDGFRRVGKLWEPVGRPVSDPYIPMVAYTEEQTEDLAYAALLVVVTEGPMADTFDAGLSRIMRADGKGKAVALASAPDARDGARTTFQHFDETHRFTLPRLKEAHRTMLANMAKRPIADPWTLETTTAFTPGESSVAESTYDYAKQVSSGAIVDSRLFYFHRWASEKHDITTKAGLKAAIDEASGPVSEWSDNEAIVEQFAAPDADISYLERVWLNRLVRATDRAFDAERWKQLARPDHVVAANAHISLGFDGARTRDTTALVATEISTGFQWLIGVWPGSSDTEQQELTANAVEVAVAELFKTYRVFRMYCDPFYWESYVRGWIGKHGKDKVVEWPTNRDRQLGILVRGYLNAMTTGEVTHRGDALFTEHIGNAYKRQTTAVDDEEKPLWVIAKERSDSPHKIDAAMAGALSWEARSHALADPKLLVRAPEVW